MPRDFDIKFRGGISRRPGQGDTNAQIPYNLHNARVTEDVVESVKAGASSFVGGAKPWVSSVTSNSSPVLHVDPVYVDGGGYVLWDGGASYIGRPVRIYNDDGEYNGYIDRAEGSVIYVTPSIGATITGEAKMDVYSGGKMLTGDDGVVAYDTFNGRTYVSFESKFVGKYNQSGEPESEPPVIKSISNYDGGLGSVTGAEAKDKRIICYLFIPVTKHDEAGEWYWWSRIVDVNKPAADDELTLHLDTSPSTHAVIVYKTPAIYYPTGVALDTSLLNDEEDGFDVEISAVYESLNWYLVGRFSAGSCGHFATLAAETSWWKYTPYDVRNLEGCESSSDCFNEGGAKFNWLQRLEGLPGGDIQKHLTFYPDADDPTHIWMGMDTDIGDDYLGGRVTVASESFIGVIESINYRSKISPLYSVEISPIAGSTPLSFTGERNVLIEIRNRRGYLEKYAIYLNTSFNPEKLIGGLITFTSLAGGPTTPDWLSNPLPIVDAGTSTYGRTYAAVDFTNGGVYKDDVQYYPAPRIEWIGGVKTGGSLMEGSGYHLVPDPSSPGQIVDFTTVDELTKLNPSGVESVSFAEATIQYSVADGQGSLTVIDNYVIDATGLLLKTNIGGFDLDLAPASSTTLTRLQNVYGTESEIFAARSVYNDGGTFLYGNVEFGSHAPVYEIKDIDKSIAVGKVEFLETDSEAGEDVKLQYEYDTPYGKVYGEAVEIVDCVKLNVPVRGFETALVVYTKDVNGVYKLFERLTPTAFGRYVSACGKLSRYTFDVSYHSNTNLGQDVQESTDRVSQHNSAFISESLRPLEITAQQIQLPDNSPIRAIMPARLAEDEGLKSYNFYIGTDKEIFYVSGNAPVYSLESITKRVGINLGYDNQPLYVNTHYGLVIYGSDNRLYYMSGRSIASIDDDVNMPAHSSTPLYTVVRDMEYVSNVQELWLATDTGVWAYEFGRVGIDGRTGFVANYDIDPARVYYDYVLQDVIVQSVDGTVKRIDHVTGDTLDDPYVETQPLLRDTRRTFIDRLECNFDGQRDVYVQHSVDLPQDAKSGQVFSETVAIEQLKPIYPKLSGVGHVLRVGNFDKLEEVSLKIVGNPHN